MSDKYRDDRHPSVSYEDIINLDASGAADYMRQRDMPDMGTDPVATDRYFSQEFFELENKYLWPRVWQMACHTDDIINEGDCFLYEIGDKSLIVTRTEDGVRAYVNSCLHRGRKLITGHCRKKEFVCPFHAITWNLEGKLTHNPIAWDFPHWTEENTKLPEAKVAEWGGFIFINFDIDAPPFEACAAPMIKDLEKFDYPNRYRAFWYEKHIRANWKTVAEPFMESHHSQTTHPQLVPALGDLNSQYDFLNTYVSRQFSAGATCSPAMDPPLTEFEKIEHMQKRGDRRVDGLDIESLPEEFRARNFLGERARENMSKTYGRDYSHAKDAELMDALLYGLFPHMTFWAGYLTTLVYRWRPEPGNPEGAIMDIMMMMPYPEGEERPKSAKKIVLGYDEKISDHEPGSASLKMVFDQDFGNIPHVQTGMKSAASGVVHFGKYAEARIRYMHKLIDRFIETGEQGTAVPKPRPAKPL